MTELIYKLVIYNNDYINDIFLRMFCITRYFYGEY